jgi:NAD-dependent deacetylase
VLKVHGDIWNLRCSVCGSEHQDLRPSIPDLPPQCRCGGIERPGVVWFGETLPQGVWLRAEGAVRRADVFFVIGTSAVVYPAAGLVSLAKSSGAKIVEVNIAETPVSSMVDASLRVPAAGILPGLIS